MIDLQDLPTVEECHALLDSINAERATGGLEPLQMLDFDGAMPGRPSNCLSARNCYVPLGYNYVGTTFVSGGERGPRPIPNAILRVTDVFDSCCVDPTWSEALRARLVEAGVVKP